MEAKICCAYNVSRGCKVSSKVTATDCAGTPFKLMKLMLDGLAKDAETGFWLTNLSLTPQIVRLFPFDFVYLDRDLKIIQWIELPPEARLPRFHPLAASALILPLNSLSSSGTIEGETLIICGEEELELRISGTVPPPPVKEAEPISVDDGSVRSAPPNAPELPSSLILVTEAKPATIPQVLVPLPTVPVIQGTGHTFALSSSWQISTSTPAGVLPDSAAIDQSEAPEECAASHDPSAMELSGVDVTDSAETLEEPHPSVSSSTLAIVEAGPEPKVALPLPADVIETDEQHTKLLPMVENPAILDTDLTAIFDAAIAEELEESIGSGGPGKSKPKARDAAPAKKPVAGVKAPEAAVGEKSPEVAKTDPNLADRAMGGTKPAPTTAREKARAPITVAETGAVAKAERERPVEKVTVTTPGVDSVYAETKSPSQGKKKSLGYFVKEFLNCPDPLPELRAEPRLVQEGMIAREKSNHVSSPMEVRDVSPAGLYLRTKKRWQPRRVFTLTLQRKGAPEDDFQSRVHMQVAAVRSDPQGVGLLWVFPKEVKFDPWRRVHTKRSDETDIQFFIREIRLTKALGFLQQVCPVAKAEIKHALLERFSNKRVASAVEIALRGEDILDSNRTFGPVLAHSEIVMRILENGSWIEEDWIRGMWAGLLVSSCCPGGDDKSNLPFLDLMARLTPIHLRIFTFVCRRAAEAIEAGQPEAKLQLYSTTKELMEAADSHSFQRIQQTIGHLCNFGLFQEIMRPSYATSDDKARTRTTPTPLGLKMYAHSLGQRTQVPAPL